MRKNWGLQPLSNVFANEKLYLTFDIPEPDSFKYLGCYAMLHDIAPGLGTE